MSLKQDVAEVLGGQIRNLVFEGGGVWGIAYEGALAELEELGVLPGVERVGGASAGAITACLLASGYTAADVGKLLRDTNFKKFTDDSFGFARDTARLLTEFGWYQGDAFRKWIRERVREKTRQLSERHGIRPPAGDRPTMAALRAWQVALAAKGLRLPELFVVGSNLSKQRREVYCAERTPTCRVEDAVRRSMSIPLFFACARGREEDCRNDVIVDGGVTWNYPVNLFDDKRYLRKPAHGVPVRYRSDPGFVFNAETLGFRLDTSKELELHLKDWMSNEPVRIDNIVSYSWALVGFIRAIANKVHLHSNDWSRTVFVDVGDTVGFTDFDLKDADKDFLSRRGREGVRKYLAWRTSPGGQAEVAAIYERM